MQIILPKLGANMDSAVLTRWFKAEGDPVEANEVIAEVSTDKVNMEIEAPEKGILIKQFFKEDDDVPVGAAIAEIGAAAAKADAPQQEERKDVQPNNSFIKISPSARRLAHTLGVDISKVKGTGPNGRIVHQDIQNYAEAANTVVEDREEIQQPQAEDHSPPQPQNMEIYQLNRIEAISGERMLHSLQSTAQLTMTRDVDVTDAVALLESVKKVQKDKITFTAFIILAVAKALQIHRRFNGKLENGKIVIPASVDLNVAVATDKGLVVPIIKDVQSKSLAAVARELNDIVTKARNSKLESRDVENGNFTITNLGASGVDTFTPILYPGQTGILGLGRILKRPWVVEDRIEIRSILSLSLTWDHQAADGAPAAQLLKSIADYLETPGLML
ncbi:MULTISPECIES: dihydrolipoamide acetyltransferase family protein [Paenibacillus]|uniref:dihydrolipoamide acetyltransferase family protein n=1 Tax=Paenibacillus TaxID=44249 RepID=UPI0008809131|nr:MULTISPECIES: dihydrolipoamide acetyltransferase family protein [Paenibacillus]NTZ19992.1 2-oxo acid dehydrogenase subunit E2 [Paenibacillus sp. JMULE4]SDI92643.1 pyruvate dehydrogenase E2 component (dihydrolipoamide acetyltransferase) [Paenibacillus naphthalenovorans]